MFVSERQDEYLQIKQQSEFLMHELQEHTELVDLYFLHSYKKLQNERKTQINQYLIRFGVTGILLPLNYFFTLDSNTNKDTFVVFLLIIFAQNFVQTARHLVFYHFHLTNRRKLMRIASSSHHCLSQDQLRFIDEQVLYQVDPQSKLKVSSVFYDFQNRQKNADVQQYQKTVRQKLGQNSIKTALQSPLCLYRSLGCLLDFISAVILIYSAILCYREQLSKSDNTFVQLYMISEIIIKTKVFGILLLLVVAPLILLFALIYVIFCKRTQKVNLPKAQTITNLMMERCNDCAICFQNFEEKQQVVEMPCSNLHIFHSECIDKWTKVKPICPTCRHILA